MTKQELARNRNWFKYYLTGMTRIVNPELLTPEELVIYNQLEKCRQSLLDNFDKCSTEKGLKVIKKCWCGKRRITNCGNKKCIYNE